MMAIIPTRPGWRRAADVSRPRAAGGAPALLELLFDLCFVARRCRARRRLSTTTRPGAGSPASAACSSRFGGHGCVTLGTPRRSTTTTLCFASHWFAAMGLVIAMAAGARPPAPRRIGRVRHRLRGAALLFWPPCSCAPAATPRASALLPAATPPATRWADRHLAGLRGGARAGPLRCSAAGMVVLLADAAAGRRRLRGFRPSTRPTSPSATACLTLIVPGEPMLPVNSAASGDPASPPAPAYARSAASGCRRRSAPTCRSSRARGPAPPARSPGARPMPRFRARSSTASS